MKYEADVTYTTSPAEGMTMCQVTVFTPDGAYSGVAHHISPSRAYAQAVERMISKYQNRPRTYFSKVLLDLPEIEDGMLKVEHPDDSRDN